jgi:flagellar basal-body rod protein FlgG
MNNILGIVLGSIHADMARMDRIAMNIANAQTPGYKREVVSVMPFAARVDGSAAAQETAVVVQADQRPGALQPTGQPLDVALTGPGWFEVMTPQGPAYTRQGNFRLDAAGRLVTQQGLPVMGSAGEIQLLQGTPVIAAAGRVFDGGAGGGSPVKAGATPVGQLRVVRFDAGAAVERVGDGLLRLAGDAAPAPEGSVEVKQGFLERSNVSHMHEMVRLMETVRHLESLQKVAVGYDELLATSIRRLGETS